MRHSAERKIVGIFRDELSDRYSFLLRALAELYPVEFHETTLGELSGLDGLLVLNGDQNTGMAAAAQGIPSFVVTRNLPPKKTRAGKVKFGNWSELDIYLRGQCMSDCEVSNSSALTTHPGDQVFAELDGCAIWISRRTPLSACQFVAVLPPAIHEGECLFPYLNARNFLGLLPLLNFLRQLVTDLDWHAPASRACFVFDDPSLYWPSYGFLNYRRLSEHATEHDYFVSIATVPLDAWWVNQRAAETFRDSDSHLSLVVHGNNHLPNELLHLDDESGAMAAAAQALRRMEGLKREYGLPFVKVMEAPHGALDKRMFEPLLNLGYEAALCTTDLLALHNPNVVWPTTFGMERSQVVGGLPVIPRIKMSADWKNDIILKAFLRQPIVIAGHHTDVADGLEFLAEMAKVIHGLEGARWSDLRGILLSNFLTKIEGDTLRVKMYSRHVKVPIPQDVEYLCVERPWLGIGGVERLDVSAGDVTRICCNAGAIIEGLPVGGEDLVDISTVSERNPLISQIPVPRFNPWPILRKGLMEIRDRFYPALAFLSLSDT